MGFCKFLWVHKFLLKVNFSALLYKVKKVCFRKKIFAIFGKLKNQEVSTRFRGFLKVELLETYGEKYSHEKLLKGREKFEKNKKYQILLKEFQEKNQFIHEENISDVE